MKNTSQTVSSKPVKNNSQVTKTGKAVKNSSQADIETIAPPIECGQATKTGKAVKNNSQDHLDDYAVYRFRINYTTKTGRQSDVIALEGYYCNVLMAMTGIDKSQIPTWIGAALDDWQAFDDKLGSTKQVKRLMMRHVENWIQAKRGVSL